MALGLFDRRLVVVYRSPLGAIRRTLLASNKGDPDSTFADGESLKG
jgi:hypothetical protein